MVTRIPTFVDKTHEGMARWFAEMAQRNLIFHPEDEPANIIAIKTGQPVFAPDECKAITETLKEMFQLFGDDVCEVCYPILTKTAGFSMQS